MVKGDDAILKKKNKANRKKMNRRNDSSTVSARIASIIASKKRRKCGKRRMCQGMCFSLPTLDDPFNDKQGKMDITQKETKKKIKGRTKSSEKESLDQTNKKADHSNIKDGEVDQKRSAASLGNERQKSEIDLRNGIMQLQKKVDAPDSLKPMSENSDCSSKFLIACLNEIENAFNSDRISDNQDGSPLSSNTWGFEFWKCYLAGNDVLETSGSSPSMEQIAWIVSTAADTMARKEKDGLLLRSPFLVFIVPSQEKAAKVRSVCKPLKSLGIHTVSLHPGASTDHQINGLKSCEPEFLVSTPERLLELVSLKGIDISGVSLLAVDDVESLSRGGYLDAVKSIKEAITGRHHTLVFNNCFSSASTTAVQSLLTGSINRVSLNDSVASQSACVTQYINVCASNEEKLLKCFEVLDHADGGDLHSRSSKLLYIVERDVKFKLGAIFKVKGYSVSTSQERHILQINQRLDSAIETKPIAYMIDVKHIDATDLGDYEVVILPDFVPSMEIYIQILTRMARYSVNGMLHSFLTKDSASKYAKSLVRILEECGQEVPEAVRELVPVSSSIMES